MSETAKLIATFWDDFRTHAAQLASATSADDPAYDRLLQSLAEIDEALYLELSIADEPRELIVTAEGRRELFPLVRRIVAEAPTIAGWTILALKPKLGFPVTIRWEGLTIELADVVFEPLEREDSDELGLRIFFPALREDQVEDAHNAILRALDHGLGEERFATSVAHTEVLPLPTGAQANDLIPLAELEKFLEWRESRRR